MVIKIIYFSSTGNTIWVINKLQKMLENVGHEVYIFDSVTADENCYIECDMIGFVYPVWGSAMPNPQREILSQLPDGNGKKLFFIGNAGVFTGDTGIYYKKRAEVKGYDVVYVDHVFLPINSIFPGFTFFKQPSDKKKKRMLKRAEKKLLTMARHLSEGIRLYRGKGLFAMLGGRGQRNHYDEIVDGFKGTLYIDQDECNQCGLCYKICPANAISYSEKGRGYVINQEQCMFCLKCYNLCPRTCALISVESRDTSVYKRYKGMDNSFRPIQYRHK